MCDTFSIVFVSSLFKNISTFEAEKKREKLNFGNLKILNYFSKYFDK